MTVPAGLAREQYAGSGTTGPFAFNHKVFVNTHLTVTKTVSGVDTTLTLTTDYSVSIATDFASATVTLVSALATGQSLTVALDPPIEQQIAYSDNDPFPAATHERALDLACMVSQALAEQISRAPLLREGSPVTGLTFPDPSANKLIGWNSAGTDLENKNAVDVGTVAFPPSSTDNAIVRFDGTAGDAVQNSVVLVDDSGNVSGIRYLDINEIAVPSNPAVDVARLYAFDDEGTTRLAFKNSAGAISLLGLLASTAGIDNEVVRFDGTTGLLQASGITVGDSKTVYPTSDGTASLGSGTNGWKDIYQRRRKGLWTNSPSFKATTITMTIASPAVVTWAAHGFIAGDTIQFTTTGAFPTGVSASTTYFVSATGLTTNTFQISATLGGTSINTSGSQSGTHSGFIQGVNITRLERLFVGAAVVNDGTIVPTGSGADWLETIAQFTVSNSEAAIVAQNGRAALTLGIRASDNNQVSTNSIGLSVYNYNDNASFVQNSWGMYTESTRSPGAGFTTCWEVAIVEKGSTVDIDPYASSFANVTSAIWNACGGEESAPNNASVGIAFLANPAKFNKGLYFSKDSINGTDGSTGTGTAIAFALGHKIDWYSAASTLGVSVYASAKGKLNIGSTSVSTEDFTVEIGVGRTGNGNCFIDLHAASGTDFEARITRQAGANGVLVLSNTGTGGIQVDAATGSIVQLLINSVDVFRATTTGPIAVNGTAIPAGGTAGTGYRFSSTANFGIFFGSGAPTLSAAQGSLYLRSDGSSTSTRLYVNTNGSTTWTNVTTAA
jgi:hypothetical protein